MRQQVLVSRKYFKDQMHIIGRTFLVRFFQIFLLAFFVFQSNNTHAAWRATTQSGDWSNTATWGGLSVPANGDQVSIGAGHTVNYYGDLSKTAGQLEIDGGRLNIVGDLTLGSSVLAGTTSVGGQLFVYGDYTQQSNFQINGGATVVVMNNMTASGNINVNNGLLVVNGNLTKSNTVTVDSNSNIVVAGNYTSTAGETWINSGNAFVFNTVTCSGSNCNLIKNFTDWNSMSSPGQTFIIGGSIDFFSPGTFSFTVPEGVTSITVECWGGGGGGGNTSHNGNGNSRGGGGAGGSYAKKTIISPSVSYSLQVGRGGIGGNDGDASWFGSETIVKAQGGQRGASASKSLGTGGLGSTVQSVGDVLFAGGNGANAFIFYNPTFSGSGGGGGGAGSTAKGKDATNDQGGTATSNNGGAGGNGISITSGLANGNPGSLFGGGGSGAVSDNNPGTARTGGAGSNGQIIISWASCTAPTISSQPASATKCTGEQVTFSVTANGPGTITYQWKKNGTNITGATSSSYTINSISTTDAGNYSVAITRSCGSSVTSNNATLTVNQLPAIASQSTAAQTQCLNGAFTSISVTATGSGTLTYQWYRNTTASNSGGEIITGATNSSYAPLATDVGTLYYYCVVTGSCGTATSTISGAFTVNPVASVASVTGSSPLCVGSTATYAANSVVLSGGTGAWSSSNAAVATVNSTTGLVTAVDAGTCSITYTITGGCGGTKSAQQSITVVAPVGDPAVFGNNIWNVYAYQGNSIDLSGITYKGYYTESNFSFSTISRWDINGSPDEATGYQGCQVTDNNHTFVYKREGFPSGTYQITIGHDDSFQLYIDDVLIDSHTTWDGNNPRVLTTFYPLNGSSKIEFRVAENAGGSRGALTFTPQCINPTDGGSIAAAQTICYGGDPAAFTSTGLPTGHAGTLEYKWQSSITSNSSGFSDINPPATGLTYDVPSGLTQTTWYKRLARVSCAEWTEVASNVLEVTVRDNFSAGAIVNTGETICSGGTPATTIGSATAASGGDNSISYQWQSSTDQTFATGVITIAHNTATYTPDQALTQTTWYRRQAKDGACAVGFTSSANTWKVTVNANPVPSFDPLPSEESCENDNESYTTQSGKLNYVWTIPSSIAGSDYTIISGGNATDNSMVLKWLTPGVKTVSVTYDDSNGCTGTVVSSTVTVHPIPEIGSFN